MSTLDISILIYGYAFGGLLSYLIDYGMNVKYQLIFCGLAFIITLCYALFSVPSEFTNVNYGFLTLPIITVLTFNLAAIISWKISGREFRATWLGARYYYTEKRNLVDYLISFFLIMIEMCWPFFIALLLKIKC